MRPYEEAFRSGREVCLLWTVQKLKLFEDIKWKRDLLVVKYWTL